MLETGNDGDGTGVEHRGGGLVAAAGRVAECAPRGRKLAFTAEQQDLILNHFLLGGDPTSGGVLHAVTSAAQLRDDADTAHGMERHALRAMEHAAAHAGGR